MGAKQLISHGFMAVFKRFKRHDQEKKQNTHGNAMVYVLLALALFGVLTATLSGQNADSDGQDLDDEMVEFYANELLEYSAAAKSVIDQMLITGSTIDDLDFVNPTSAAFDTPPHIHKVFHPAGGGLTYIYDINKKMDEHPTQDPSWQYNTSTNVEWTPTIANDIILTAHVIPESICRHINKKITGSENIPLLPNQLSDYFIEGDPDSRDLNAADCASCEGYYTFSISKLLDKLK